MAPPDPGAPTLVMNWFISILLSFFLFDGAGLRHCVTFVTEGDVARSRILIGHDASRHLVFLRGPQRESRPVAVGR
jgi:hypothetical protein